MPKALKGRNANARVSEELYLEIQGHAEHLDVSAGYIIRQAIKEYILAHPINTQEAIKRRADKQIRINGLREKMNQATDKLDFEEALRLRDQIRDLEG